MVTVIATDEFVEWYRGLGSRDADAVYRIVGLLEARGVQLGHPYCSAIRGSRFPLRELRTRSGRRALRVLYAFDPARRAVLLLGGDKSGDDRFYEVMIPRAERVLVEYLEDAPWTNEE